MKHPRIQEAEAALDEYFFSDGSEELLARALMLDEFNRRDGILPEKLEA